MKNETLSIKQFLSNKGRLILAFPLSLIIYGILYCLMVILAEQVGIDMFYFLSSSQTATTIFLFLYIFIIVRPFYIFFAKRVDISKIVQKKHKQQAIYALSAYLFSILLSRCAYEIGFSYEVSSAIPLIFMSFQLIAVFISQFKIEDE